MKEPRGRARAESAVDDEADHNRARRLLDVPDRYKCGRDVQVPGLSGTIRLCVLTNKQTREAHAAARKWCQDEGFNPDGHDLSHSGTEFSVACATQMLLRSCVHAKTGFPLWDTEEELCEDLTREQIRWLEAKRQAFQMDVAPPLEDATPEMFSEVIEAAKKGRKGETVAAYFARSPRSTLLAFGHFLDAQLPKLTGWTFFPTSTTGTQDGAS